MSPVLIISVIVVVLLAVVTYAFVFQTIDNKRKQRQRVITALKQRAGNFAYMISGFPTDFLTKDLTVLVYRCLMDVNEQLAKLDPSDDSHLHALEKYREAMVKAQERTDAGKRVQLASLQQIKDVRTHLQDLHKFVEKLLQKRQLDGTHAKAYSKQIQKLILQISIDAYLMSAKQAEQNGKARLALHHYILARKMLNRENTDKAYSKHIAQIDLVIQELEKRLLEETKSPSPFASDAGPAPTASREWDEFETQEAGWKKKTIYD
jgi:hypothetical protein